MLIYIAIILGIVEGLTEFLPVSSTGHLIIVGYALNFSDAKAATFQIFIQLGAILAIVWLYFDRFRQLLHFARSKEHGDKLPDNEGLRGKNGLLLLGLTTLPAMFAGLLLHSFIKEQLFQPLTVAIGLIAGSIVILIFERSLERHPQAFRTIKLDAMTRKQALGIGCAQLVALWPGVSRSGATIIGGMLYGLDRKTAVEYSFLAAVPVMIAATTYDLYKNLNILQVSDIPLFATGFVTAFISAALAVKYLVRFVQRYSFKPFAYYRIALAIVVLIVLA